MIGTADTIYATSCENYGLIRGGQSQQQDFAPVGTGGFAAAPGRRSSRPASIPLK